MLAKRPNIVEQDANKFWGASLAWKRVPGFVETATIGGLFETLAPLKEHYKSPQLRTQAQDLATLIVKGTTRRKKRKSDVILLPKKAVPMINVEAA